MKGKMLAMAAALLCMVTVIGGTAAYHTYPDVAHNVITTEGVDIELRETMLEKGPGGASREVPFPGRIENVMPHSSASKIVRVENKTGTDAWLRARLIITVTGKDGQQLPLDEGDVQLVTPAGADELWEKEPGSEWYYYTKPLAGDAVTEPLLREVAFAPQMGNAYQESTVTVRVEAEAVQLANNGTTVYEARPWVDENIV